MVVFILSLILVSVGLYGVHNYLGGRVYNLNETIASKKADLSYYEAQVAEVKRLQQHIDMVGERLNTIRDLERFKGAQIQMMEDMTTRVVEKRMWLESLENTDNSLRLQGLALDNTTVANFMKKLEASGQFVSVDLVNVVRTTYLEQSMKKFVIVCNKPVAAEPEKKEG
ncbi:MAG: PilN domain-containing protein [Proteobacteria bacterium]|nr:PilN domain-containing protein [Pseudomonadota bacterium]